MIDRARTPGALLAALTLVLTTAPRLGAQTNDVGLDPMRSVLLANENLIFYTPQNDDLFGFAVAAGDFNGDGADDLATGIPLDDGRVSDPVADCGGVVVRYGTVGSPFDPDQAATTFLNQQQSGSPDSAEPGDRHGRALTTGDFNGDGFSDLAIGAPSDANTPADEGLIFIHYGGPGGVALVAEHVLEANTLSPGTNYAFAQFGYALAAGNFDGDGFDDLAIGGPYYHVFNGDIYGEAVLVFHGGAGGLLPANGYYIRQGDDTVDEQEGGDRFGLALAAGDFDGSGHDDLAIGVPGEDSSGAVQVLFGSQWGLLFASSVVYREFDLGLSYGAGDDFGAALSSGDFDADGFADLAIGAPYRDVVRNRPTGPVTFTDAGWVTAIYGAPAGFDLQKTQQWSQGTVFPPNASEDEDRFGFALTAADFDADGATDLAIGAPGETVAAFTVGHNDGEVDVVMGSATGLTAMRRRAFLEGYEGLAGDLAQHQKHFGHALTSGDFSGDGHPDLAVGVPYRDASGVANAGAEIVISSVANLLLVDGFESGDTTRWSGASPPP